MTIALLGSVAGTLLGWLMGFLSLFLIMLILVQRGKGGGLTGALGGPGGQSAFGSKAGDTFTVITIVVASIWGFTCAFTMWLLGTHTPTAITDTATLSAGPGDEDSETPPPVDPLSSSSGLLDSQDRPVGADASSSGTPSADLIPATPSTDASESDASESGATESDAAEPSESDAEAADSESGDAAASDAESAESTSDADASTPDDSSEESSGNN
ncbi:MAG: preprotein translocase subunit SecG [Rubripirellula sp.]